MIYFCADDYGIDENVSKYIRQCVDKHALGKVSVFVNFGEVDLNGLKDKNVRLALHLNLVEGKCLAADVPLLADENGNFRHTFIGLLRQNIFHATELEKQLYKEIRAQVVKWKSILPKGAPFCIDTHQHTSMIPAVFNAILRVLKDEEINVNHIRIPVEPLTPFIMTPSLYHTYNIVNIIKQWLLNFLWLFNRRKAKNIRDAYFFGILFSGKMDAKRVAKILPRYKKLAEKNGADIEVLFHPGYTDKLSNENVVFEKFYLSDDRKTEFDSVMTLKEV